jgi:hypothetical protein
MPGPTPYNSPAVQGSAASSTVSTVSPAFTPANGDIIIVKAASEKIATIGGTPTGGGQTFTGITSAVVGEGWAGLWWCVVSGSPGSMSVTVAWSGSNGWHSSITEAYTGAQLGTPATMNAAGGSAPSGTITTQAANSTVSWLDCDFNAIAPGSRAYRSSATETGIHDKSTASYVAYYAYQNAASAGSQTCGLTAPTGQQPRLLGVEVESAAVAAQLPELIMAPYRY